MCLNKMTCVRQCRWLDLRSFPDMKGLYLSSGQLHTHYINCVKSIFVQRPVSHLRLFACFFGGVLLDLFKENEASRCISDWWGAESGFSFCFCPSSFCTCPSCCLSPVFVPVSTMEPASLVQFSSETPCPLPISVAPQLPVARRCSKVWP